MKAIHTLHKDPVLTRKVEIRTTQGIYLTQPQIPKSCAAIVPADVRAWCCDAVHAWFRACCCDAVHTLFRAWCFDAVYALSSQASDLMADAEAPLPAWKAALFARRAAAAADRANWKATETIKRDTVAAGTSEAARLRGDKAGNDDDGQIVTYAPGQRLGRFHRPADMTVCSPIALSLLAEALGMRIFTTLSEVCSGWYDGVRAKEDEWAVLGVRSDGGLGSGTGDASGELDLPTYATMLPGAAICVCDSGNARLQAFSPQGRVRGLFHIGKGIKGGQAHLSVPCTVTCDTARKTLYVVDSHGRLLKYRVLLGVGGASLNFERVRPHAKPAGATGGFDAWECSRCTYLHAAAEADNIKCARCGQTRTRTPHEQAMAVDAAEGCVLLGAELFVTCARFHRVVVFDTQTLLAVRTFGSVGRTPSALLLAPTHTRAQRPPTSPLERGSATIPTCVRARFPPSHILPRIVRMAARTRVGAAAMPAGRGCAPW